MKISDQDTKSNKFWPKKFLQDWSKTEERTLNWDVP